MLRRIAWFVVFALILGSVVLGWRYLPREYNPFALCR
jgi:hypothetical protein